MLVKNRRQAEHPPRSGYLSHVGLQPDDVITPLSIGGCIARQGRRQIKAAAKECTTVLD